MDKKMETILMGYIGFGVLGLRLRAQGPEILMKMPAYLVKPMQALHNLHTDFV